MNLELYLLAYLKTALNTTAVHLMVPEDKPSEFFIIDKLGSRRENQLTTTHVAIQSWGKSVLDALQKNDTVKGIMLDDLPKEKEIASVRLNSDYPYHDTATKHPRYQAVFDIVHY